MRRQRPFHRAVLATAMLPAALALPASAAEIFWNGSQTPYILNVNPVYGEGLREGYTNVSDDETTAIGSANIGPNNGQGFGISLGLRMAQSTTFEATTGWANPRTWIYSGEVFTGPNGVISFAANLDDTDWLRLDGAVVLNDNGWNTAVATTVQGLTPNSWVQFEYRGSDTGAGGAGPSAQNAPAGAAGWTNTIGAVMSHDNEANSLNVASYSGGNGLGQPAEVANGTPTLFRYLITAGAGGDNVHVTANSEVTLTGTGTSVQENQLLFEAGATPVTLTFNNSDAVQRTLAASLTSPGNANNAVTNIAGTGHVRVGQILDSAFTGIVLTKLSGTGDLIFDTATNDLNGTTLRVVDGRLSIQGNNFNPVSSLLNPIAVDGAGAKLRFGGVGADLTRTTFNSSVNFNESGTLEHTSLRTDTLTGTINVATTKTLNADLAGGALRTTGALNGSGGSLLKTGPGELELGGDTTLDTVTVTGGRLRLNGNTTLLNSPTINAGGTLALTGTGVTYTFPAPLTVPTGGTLELFPAPAGTRQTNLTGGLLVLDSPKGLVGEYWNTTPTNTNNSNPNWGPTTLTQGTGNPNGTNTPGSGDFTAFQNLYGPTGPGTGTLGAPGLTALTTANGVTQFDFGNANGGNGAPYQVFGFNAVDNIQARWSGKFFAPVAGVYAISTTSDDGSAVFVNGQSVAYNNAYQGMTNRGGTVFLQPGLHDIVIGHYEGGGGAGMQVFVTPPGGSNIFLQNSSLYPNGDVPVFNNPVNVAENSTINTAYFAAVASDLTVQPGKTLTTTGSQLTASLLKFPAAGTYGITTSGVDNVLVASVLSDGDNTVTINKSGEGLFVLDNTTTAQLNNPNNIINLSQGTLGILLASGGFSPTGQAVINFNGGGLVLSSKGGDQTYPLPPAFGGTNPAVEARKIGSGVAGPVNVTLGGNLNVPSTQTLGLKTADDYTMLLGGTANLGGGAGTVSINGGRVNATTNGALGGLNIAFNTLTSAILNFRTATPTIASLSSTSASTAAQVLLGDGTINSTLVIDQATNTDFAGALTQQTGSVGNVIKRGAGRLTLSGTGHNYSGGLTIEAGTVNTFGAGLGSGAVTLSGGILQAGRMAGLFGEYWDATVGGDGGAEGAFAGDLNLFNAYFAGKGAPVVSAQTTTNGRLNLKFSDGGGIEGGGPDTATFGDQGFAATNNMAVRFSGVINVPVDGDYTFTTRSDDGSVVFIDGVKVVNNNFYQGMTTRGGVINLTAGPHNISVGFYEGGGGSGLEVRYTPVGGIDQFIPNTVLKGIPNLVGTNTVTLTASSTIDPLGGLVQLGTLTMPPNLTLTGLDGTIRFPSAVLTGTGGTTYNFNQVAGSIGFDVLTDGGNEVDIVKLGAGRLVLVSPATPHLTGANSSITVNGGLVQGVGGGANSPFGSVPITVNTGAGIAFGSTAPTAAFNNPITLTGVTSVTAGNPGFGAVNNATVTVQVPLNNAAGGTLNLSTTNGYTLNLDTVTGGGALNMTHGIVNANAPVAAGAVTVSGPTPTGANLTSSTFTAFDNFSATSVAIQANGALRTSGGVVVPGGIDIGSSGELQVTGGGHNAAVTLTGGLVRAVNGVTDFGANTISGSAPAITSNALRGLLQMTGLDNNGPAFPGNTDAGILGAQLRAPQATINLTGPVNIVNNAAADGNFSTLFGGVPLTGQRFTAAFTGRLTATEAGIWQFRMTTVDDTSAFWVDLNQNGIFETQGSAGNEAISSQGCCGDGPTGQATLVLGQTYNVAFAVEDTGGDSGVTANFQRPSDTGLILVNPGAAAQAGVWSFNSAATQGGVIVEAGAELRAARINQATVATLTGAGAKLLLSSGTAVTDAIDGLSALIGGGSGTLELAANNTLNAGSVSVSPTGTLIKAGAGTLNAAAQSLGVGGTLQVDGGLVNLNGLANAFNGTVPGAANSGGVVVNATGRVNVNGAISGAVQVNTGGTLGGSGTAGISTVAADGNLSPGAGVGTLSTLDVTLSASANLAIEILNATSFDRLNASGAVSLDQSDLALSLLPGFVITTGDLFFIVTNDLADPAIGTFAGLADGATFNVSGADFRIEYDADFGTLAQAGGNDVVLVALNTIPEPGALAALLGGAGVLVGLRRFRRQG